jgi:GGDEF domain-containing protein
MLETLLDAFFESVFGGSIIPPPLGQVGLRHIGALKIVAVEVAFPVPKPLRAGARKMAIPGFMLRQAVLHTRVPGPDGGEGMPLSVSFGVALWDPEAFPECDGDQLQQLADDCLYEAKRQGRNRVVSRQAAA